jgi:hypothetical protein
LGGIHGGEEEGGRELTGRCRLGRQQRTELWSTWGAAGLGTLPAAAIGTTSPSSRCHPAPLPARAASDRHSRPALLVPTGGQPGQPVELHVSASHHHVREHGQRPAGILFCGALRSSKQRKEVGEPTPTGPPAA